MVKISTTEAKMSAPKKTIKLEGMRVDMLRLVDEDGVDVTKEVVDALPEGTDYISFKIVCELPDEEVSE